QLRTSPCRLVRRRCAPVDDILRASRWLCTGETDQGLKPDEQKEEGNPDARAQRRPPVAREDADESLEHPARRVFVEEQVAEFRRVEADHEAAERPEALPLAPREAAEALDGEIARGKARVDRLRRLEPRLERDRDAGRENRIQERARVSRQ